MKTILVSAYAVNPFKGSEDGMGWNFILQISRFNKVIAFTRCNNREAIERYQQTHPEYAFLYQHISFMYFDWPSWMLGWKKGPLLSLIYYYCWQLSLALYLLLKKVKADIVHNLNFHNDWTPTFLWLLGRPLVWGPVGHHSKIPARLLRASYGVKEYVQDRFLWLLKKLFWTFDPFLKISKWRAAHVLCMNTEAAKKLGLRKNFSIVPSVASEEVLNHSATRNGFTVLSVGRFVPLKGFEMSIDAFAAFYYSLNAQQRLSARLVLIGAGPYKKMLQARITDLKIAACTRIMEWLPRQELAALYRSAAVFLFPSYEGAGMVVAEAMSYGLPVICWDNEGPGEFVHKQSGLRVPYGNYDDSVTRFATQLETLYVNPELLLKESQLALEQHRHFFNWNVRGSQLQKVYEQLG